MAPWDLFFPKALRVNISMDPYESISSMAMPMLCQCYGSPRYHPFSAGAALDVHSPWAHGIHGIYGIGVWIHPLSNIFVLDSPH